MKNYEWNICWLLFCFCEHNIEKSFQSPGIENLHYIGAMKRYLFFHRTSPEEVSKVIEDMKTKYSKGIDDTTTVEIRRLPKQCSP